MLKEKLNFLGIAVVIGFLTGVSFYFGFFSGPENFLEDLLFFPKPIHQDIVIVSIDSDSISKIGQWPWPREVFGKALLELQKNPPKVVGLDVIFSEVSRLENNDDLALASALNQVSYPVILPVEAQPLILEKDKLPAAGKFLKPLPELESAKSVSLGHVNLVLDADGVARRFPLKIGDFNAMPYEIVKKSGLEIPDEKNLININRIVFSSPTGSIRRVPFWRVLEGDVPRSQSDRDPGLNGLGTGELLKDKIVLIGATAPDLHDEKPTPFSRGTQMPGVEIQANIVNMLVSGYRLAPLRFWPAVVWIFSAALLSEAVFLVLKGALWPLLGNIFLGFIYSVAAVFLFDKGIAVNLIHLNFAWILSAAGLLSYRYFASEKGRREMKALFSKYVSKDVLEEILKNPDKVKLGGETREVTVFFSDVKGFTTLSEKTSPQELVKVMNEYFTLMTEEVLKRGGVLDKYIGDAIMAFWGAPIGDEQQADHALQAAIGMTEKLKTLNAKLKKSGKPEIGTRIGIYTGPALAGNIGSELRLNYTVMGDTVNVASRLEGINKEYGTQIIIGESTKNKLKGKYDLKSLGSVAIKGRAEPLNIYTVIF
ncbi:MAG: adenylate/guanylate cyclase domain-containing protein [Candidatus Harrisonbacteria bacterium]|nr:adenylate/guanylate cyclase domain-containing protein [Candidatus Harrisonbacteria bacterium]